MPLTNIDYTNTIIYKLCCKDLVITDIYVGHTTDMRKRKYLHKSVCNNEKNKKYYFNVYKFIRDNGNWDNWDMIEIERFEAIDGDDARKRERYWIEELKATLNNKIPTRTMKEYGVIYRDKNNVYINEKVICECGCERDRKNLARHKQSKKHIDLMSQPMRSSMITLASAGDEETTVI